MSSVKLIRAAGASPLAHEILKIKGGSPVAPVLRSVVGDSTAEKLVTAAMRVRHFEGTGEGLRPSREKRHQGSARVEFAPEAVRPSNHVVVQRMAILLLMVLEHLPKCGSKIMTQKLWLGPHVGPGVGNSLAARLGCSVREIERYLVVLRQAQVLRTWQPPAEKVANKRLVGRRSGRAYNCWQLIGELPRELLARLRPAFSAGARAADAARSEPIHARHGRSDAAAAFMQKVSPPLPEAAGPPAAGPPPVARKAPSVVVAAFMAMIPTQ